MNMLIFIEQLFEPPIRVGNLIGGGFMEDATADPMYSFIYASRKIGRVQQRNEPPDLIISVISTSIT